MRGDRAVRAVGPLGIDLRPSIAAGEHLVEQFLGAEPVIERGLQSIAGEAHVFVIDLRPVAEIDRRVLEAGPLLDRRRIGAESQQLPIDRRMRSGRVISVAPEIAARRELCCKAGIRSILVAAKSIQGTTVRRISVPRHTPI